MNKSQEEGDDNMRTKTQNTAIIANAADVIKNATNLALSMIAKEVDPEGMLSQQSLTTEEAVELAKQELQGE